MIVRLYLTLGLALLSITALPQDYIKGSVSQRWYASSFRPDMKQRRLSVYLPPGYDSEESRRYPVLYLLHGMGGDEMSWINEGRLAEIMDSMITGRLCVPMIVVMPNGMADLDATPGESPYMEGKAKGVNFESWMGRTEAAFPKEVMPFIEEEYRTLNDKNGRAIAGLSMGGMHAMAISCNCPDLFDYVGLFSPQTKNVLTDSNIKSIKKTTGKLDRILDNVPFTKESIKNKLQTDKQRLADIDIYADIDAKLVKQFEAPPALYYIAIGRKDPLKRMLGKFLKRMDSLGCTYYYIETDGGHTWDNWQRYLIDFLPRIFLLAD